MKFLFVSALILLSIESFNQTIDRSVLSSSGNSSKTETISVSWTLGEVAIAMLNSDGQILSQGFQQSNLYVNAIEGIEVDFQLKTYPNPVIDKLIVETSDLDQFYEIIDVNGRILDNGFIDSYTFELDFTNLPPGPYFLRVEKKLTHKIIKE